MKENNLLMPFIDESESFTNGFECGQIWQRLFDGILLTSYPIHLENSAQIQSICDHFNVECKITLMHDGWGALTTDY